MNAPLNTPLLQVKGLKKIYQTGLLKKRETFRLEADFNINSSQIVGVMGPNGSGKTTMFELITGSNQPTAGEVLCAGQNIHNVKYRSRDRLAIHYHQSYQVRHFAKTKPSFMLENPVTDYPLIHLFDEPQFNTQDGYIGFMLEFFKKLKSEGRLVFLCVHPNEPFHVKIMREICDSYLFVQKGRVSQADDYDTLLENPDVTNYLGSLAQY
ncbi:MAG: ATP-binding cassette domain-containing protein [Pseudomonadales bacterium]|nr:ATP-binding cassette domain-containing protein [Pseudomonadales bacterium]